MRHKEPMLSSTPVDHIVNDPHVYYTTLLHGPRHAHTRAHNSEVAPQITAWQVAAAAPCTMHARERHDMHARQVQLWTHA